MQWSHHLKVERQEEQMSPTISTAPPPDLVPHIPVGWLTGVKSSALRSLCTPSPHHFWSHCSLNRLKAIDRSILALPFWLLVNWGDSQQTPCESQQTPKAPWAASTSDSHERQQRRMRSPNAFIFFLSPGMGTALQHFLALCSHLLVLARSLALGHTLDLASFFSYLCPYIKKSGSGAGEIEWR